MTVRGLSIKAKLPLLIGGLLGVVTVIYGGAAYQAVRRSSAGAAIARLGTVTDQLAQLLTTSRDQLVAGARAVADSPAVRAYAVRPAADRRGAAEMALRPTVEDNGIGIAPEHHERIFRVFERLHRSSDYPGTGIGLAIVRKAMERMGGTSGVESQLGQGSRFWIELPRADGG
jgi:light-regulated signal transduction histidine kinase (bacteriophytochrome)